MIGTSYFRPLKIHSRILPSTQPTTDISTHLKIHKLSMQKVKHQTLMVNLWSMYGQIKIEDLKYNDAPPTPIKRLLKPRHDGGKVSEEGKETISDSQLVRYGYDNVLAIGYSQHNLQSEGNGKLQSKLGMNFKEVLLN